MQYRHFSMKLINEIKNAKCLVLDKRIEFWPTLKESFQQRGITVNRFLAGDGHLKDEQYDYIDTNDVTPSYYGGTDYATWYNRPNAFNAWKCHKLMFQSSLLDGFDHLLLIEDDAFIENDFDDILEKTEEFWDIHQYDIIYFGCYPQPNGLQPTTNPYLFKATKVAGFHAVLLTKPVIEKLLSFFALGPYDEICWKYINSKVHAWAFNPCIISQKSGYSFVEGSNLEKPSRLYK